MDRTAVSRLRHPDVHSARTDTPCIRPSSGLFRTAVAGRPVLLSDAFRILRDSKSAGSPQVAGDPGSFCGLVTAGHGENWEMFCLNDDAYVVVSDCHFSNRRTEQVLGEGFIEFHFTLSGAASTIDEAQRITQVDGFDLTVCCLGAQASYMVSCEKGCRRSVAIYMRHEFFERFLSRSSDVAQAICQEVSGVGPHDALIRRLPIDSARAQLVNQILDNPFTDGRRILFLHAKVMEIVCVSLGPWAAAIGESGVAPRLSTRDIARIHEARRLILEDTGHFMTIEALSKRVGVNTSKLKSGFRSLYNCTVFEFGLQARMEKALLMLKAEKASVTEVAESVGYSHISSFSAAFNRHFGFTPRQAREQNLENV